MAFSRLFSVAAAVLSLCTSGAAYKEKPSIFTFTPDGTGLQLGGPGIAPEIRVAPNDLPGVKRVVKDLAADFGRVLGVNGTVVTADWSTTAAVKADSKPIIVVGTIGQSSLVDSLVAAKKLDVTAVAGKWETYTYQVIASPWEGRDAILVVAGSDARGAAFGVYDIAERIGVSPWHFWADVPPTKRQYIWAGNGIHAEGPPSVKYRGIFLNDESPGLTGWGRTRFKVSQYGSPFVSEFYQHIFDLVVRLKGNYVWPAMWSSMFYLDDPKNGPMATEYGIFMGTSHHEPMARADKEQGRFLKGSWDWRSNKAGVQSFMEEGATRAKNWSTIFTLGMRGSGDAASATLSASALEEIIAWQQSTLQRAVGKPLSEIPQAWVMYKEVPGYWQKGMKVSDDVTLLWSDDNRGNIRRVPIGNEQNRRGGSGMYYHFDYVGDPRNYKWINTIQLQKTWEQMTLVYDRGIDKIWIANVGDLKALELPTAHFMALAWDRDAFAEYDSTKKWLRAWSARQWGEAVADATANIMTAYGKLISRMKYEDLSRTPFAFNALNYDEAERNFEEWTALLAQAQAAHDKLWGDVQTSFWSVVLHPIQAGRGVYQIYTNTALGTRYANEHRVSANKLARDAQTAFSTDVDITRRYHSIFNNKWNNILAQTHIGYNNWQEPSSNSMPRQTFVTSAAKNALMGVSVQHSTSAFPATTRLTLPALTPFMGPSDRRWIDIYARDNGTFTYSIVSNASYVLVTNPSASIVAPNGPTDIRSLVTVDWTTAPAGASTASLTITNLNQTTAVATVLVPLENHSSRLPADFIRHVETNGVISIEAQHYSRPLSSPSYITIPHYGRTLSGVKLPPKTPTQQIGKAGAAVLVYPFFTFSAATSASLTIYLSPSENAIPTSPNKFAWSVDGGSASTVQPVPSSDGSSQPAGWSEGVIQGSYVRKVTIGRLSEGKHELRFWLNEPTMLVTKLVVDVGGLKASMMGPPENRMVGADMWVDV